MILVRGCAARHTPAPAFCRRIGIDLPIAATEGIMDCDATCLGLGPASLLLHLIGFLVYGGVALSALCGLAGIIAKRVRGSAWFRRSQPSLYQKCLAVHIEGAGVRSALR
jgi:hypothetical protein